MIREDLRLKILDIDSISLEISKKIMSESFYILCLSMLDMCGSSTILPFLPIIADDLGASTLKIGFIQFIYASLQTLFGPLIGNFSDNFGKKLTLKLGFIASIVTQILLLLSLKFKYKYYVLYICIIPMAIFRHSQACLKSFIAHKSQSNNIKTQTKAINNNASNNSETESLLPKPKKIPPKKSNAK